jgi:hypothetical protein
MDIRMKVDAIEFVRERSPLKPDTVSASVSLLFRNLKLPEGASLHTLRHTQDRTSSRQACR